MSIKDFTSVVTAVSGFLVAVTGLYHEYRMDREAKEEKKRKAKAKKEKEKKKKSEDDDE